MTKQEIINQLQTLLNSSKYILGCAKKSTADKQYIARCKAALFYEFVENGEEIIKYLNEHRCCKYKCK